ncbi:hypothetical protein ACFO3I_07900 [Rheinheimera marina]|uniref:Transporter n=1 Tax=Rheinheimera marina TaxID=1774958 RepID=A0ABV9JL15_9GAMM
MKIAKNLLWIDCTAGALAGILVISLSGWLTDLYSTSQSFLLVIGTVNLLYAWYSFTLATRRRRQESLIKILVCANGIWALICIAIVTQFSGNMTLLGCAHLIVEAVFVGGLAAMEWKWRNQLLIAT